MSNLLERRLDLMGVLFRYNNEKKDVKVSVEALPSEELFMKVDVSDYFWWNVVKDLQYIELKQQEYRGPVDPLDDVAAESKRLSDMADQISNQDYTKHLAGLEFSSFCMNSSGGSIFESKDCEEDSDFDCDIDCKYFCNMEVSKLDCEDNQLSMYELASLFIMREGLSEEFLDFVDNY